MFWKHMSAIGRSTDKLRRRMLEFSGQGGGLELAQLLGH